MKIHLQQRLVQLEQHDLNRPLAWIRLRPRLAGPAATSWLLVACPPLPEGAEEFARDGTVELLHPGPREDPVVPGDPELAQYDGVLPPVRTHLNFRVTRDVFLVLNIEVQPSMRRLGIASALAERTHQAIAPTRRPVLDSPTSSSGRSWNRFMVTSRGWST